MKMLRRMLIEPNIRDYFSILVLTYKKKQTPPPPAKKNKTKQKTVIISQSIAE